MSTPHPDIEFHNTSGPEASYDGSGWLLPRYPRKTYTQLESPGFLTAHESTGVELRFVTPARHLRVFLRPLDRPCDVFVYKGDFLQVRHTLAPGVVHAIQLTPPDNLATIRAEAAFRRFHPDVWRVQLDRGPVVFHGLDTYGTPVRSPRANEKPTLRWLAYGSSITHSHHGGYPQRAALRLGVDVQNKGLSGSCYVEPAASEFIASDCEWDFATLEMGVNMLATLPPEEYERRVRLMVSRCTEAKPGRPVVLITVFQMADDQLVAPGAQTEKLRAFRDIMRTVAADFRDRNVHLVEGTDIVDHITLLSADLVHPTEYGHDRMAENLARFLQPILLTAKRHR